MTIYDELKEQASKGPFEVTFDLSVLDFRGDEIADCCSPDGSVEQDEANAQLIAHRGNNFDQLLEVVEFIDDQFDQFLADESMSRRGRAFIRGLKFSYEEALKAAQEVKV